MILVGGCKERTKQEGQHEAIFFLEWGCQLESLCPCTLYYVQGKMGYFAKDKIILIQLLWICMDLKEA